MRSIVAAVLLLIAAGCSDAMGPSIPRDVTQYDPPEVYFDWWSEVLRDLHEIGTAIEGEPAMDRLVWFEVNQGAWQDPRYSGYIVGTWTARGHVFIARGYVRDEGIVKHEMLHEILGPESGTHAHPLFRIYEAGRMRNGKPIPYF